jgi:hypothetical protein
MGCHTWLYRKIEDPPYKEVQEFVIAFLRNEIELIRGFHQRSLDNQLTEEDKEMLEHYPEWITEKHVNHTNIYERQIQMIEKDLHKSATCKRYADWKPGIESKSMFYIEGKGFYESLEYCDIFRKHDFPDDILFSYEDTISYVRDPKNGCIVYDEMHNIGNGKQVHFDSYVAILDFWTENPDGMIRFG